MKGAIAMSAHVSNVDGNGFYHDVAKCINEMQGINLEIEVQYQTTMYPNGIALYSALILGREKEN